jgi:DNA polymerase-3 subunit alpha
MDDLDAPVDTETILRHWLNEGWKFRGFNKLPRSTQKEYIDRVNYEFDLMKMKDFLDYFAVLSDVVREAKLREVAVGPARGSAAASLCCFLWRITEVNPMLYPNMLFERFIDPNRMDVPDIDLDFEDDRRDVVRQIMIEKYGNERVGNIGTFTRYRGKNAIDDVARVYSIPRVEVDAAKEFLVERSGGDSRFDASIMDTVEMFPQVKEVFEKYPDLYHAIELEGNYKAFGVHAAGLVIGNDDLSRYVATYSRDIGTGAKKKTVQVLSVDKYDGEHLGLMKLDALGLQTMGMIRIALDMLGLRLDDLYAIPMDDEKTLEAFYNADVVGIFQFEGRTMKMVTEEMKPRTFMDLAAINALSRPGPLHSGSTGDYLAIRHGRQQREDLHPIVAKICETTEGQIIYQEQILQITRDVGKFPWTHASRIRSIISHKEGESAFNSMYPDFVKGAAESDIPEPVAKEIWKRMATAGTYAFNIAHCISYSMLGFWAMYLKVHHPLEFYAAQLQKTPHDEKEKDVILMRDMMNPKFGRTFKVLPPTAEESRASWQPTAGGVRAGFKQIPGVGEVTAEKIVEFVEKHGALDTFHDLRSDRGGIKGIGIKTVQKIEEFAEGDDPFGIYKLVREIDSIKTAIASDDLPGLPMPNAVADDVPYEARKWHGVVLCRLRSRNLKDLFEDHRSRTGDELDPETVKNPELKDSMTLYMEDSSGLLTAKISRHLYPKYKGDVWNAKIGHDYILASVFTYPFLGKTVHIERMWVVDPD